MSGRVVDRPDLLTKRKLPGVKPLPDRPDYEASYLRRRGREERRYRRDRGYREDRDDYWARRRGEQARWDALIPGLDQEPDPIRYATALLDAMGERERTIFLQRRGFRPASLEEVGASLVLTRERVRQIEVALLDKMYGAEYSVAAERVRADLGVAIPVDHLPDYLSGIPANAPTAVLLACVAGEYKNSRDGWLCRRDVEQIDEYFGSVMASALSGGAIPTTDARRIITEAGVRPEHVDAIIRRLPGVDVLEVLGGLVVDTRGGMADTAVSLMGGLSGPVTDDWLLDQMRVLGKATKRTTRNSFQGRTAGDPRVVRVRLGYLGLVSQGYRQFEGIVGEAKRVVDERGEPVSLAELAEDLHERFGVTVGSVQSTVKQSPDLIVEGGMVAAF